MVHMRQTGEPCLEVSNKLALFQAQIIILVEDPCVQTGKKTQETAPPELPFFPSSSFRKVEFFPSRCLTILTVISPLIQPEQSQKSMCLHQPVHSEYLDYILSTCIYTYLPICEIWSCFYVYLSGSLCISGSVHVTSILFNAYSYILYVHGCPRPLRVNITCPEMLVCASLTSAGVLRWVNNWHS